MRSDVFPADILRTVLLRIQACNPFTAGFSEELQTPFGVVTAWTTTAPPALNVSVEIDPFALRSLETKTPLRPTEPLPYSSPGFLGLGLETLLGTNLLNTRARLPDDLEVDITAVNDRPSTDTLERLFSPLGFSVQREAIASPFRTSHAGSARLRLGVHGDVTTVLGQLVPLLLALDDAPRRFLHTKKLERIVYRRLGTMPHPDRGFVFDLALGRHQPSVHTKRARPPLEPCWLIYRKWRQLSRNLARSSTQTRPSPTTNGEGYGERTRS